MIRVIVQSRLGSTRLPGKGMLSIAGVPLVVLAAARAGNTGIDVVIATSEETEDDVIAGAAEHAGINVVRGSLDDPLSRFVKASQDLARDDIVVRLTADNAFPDGQFVEMLADAVDHEGRYVRAGGDPMGELPYGVAGEAFPVWLLRKADDAASSQYEREHVTPWMRAEHGDRAVHPDRVNPAWRGLRSTIDTFDDFVRVAKLFRSVTDPVGARWEELADSLVASTGTMLRIPRAPRRTGAEHSRLILGTAQLGLAYGASNSNGAPDRREAGSILEAAAKCGVTHVDTARAYGASEGRIGESLSRGLSEHLDVVTKIDPLDQLPNEGDRAWGTAMVRASYLQSLVALRATSVDTLLVHRANDWFKPGVREALIEAKQSQLARAIGVSLSTPAQLMRILADPEIDYVQLPFNLVDGRWLAPAVQEQVAGRPDVFITARSVFLQGLLTGAPSTRWPRNKGIDPVRITAATGRLVEDFGRLSRIDLALAYALAQPWIASVVVGAEQAEQVRELAHLALRDPLSADQQAAVRREFADAPGALVDPSEWELT